MALIGKLRTHFLENGMVCLSISNISRRPKCQNISQELKNLCMFLFDEIHTPAWTNRKGMNELLTSLWKYPFPVRSTCSSPDGLYKPSSGRPLAHSCLWTWCAAVQHQTTLEGWRPADASASLCSDHQNPITTRWVWGDQGGTRWHNVSDKIKSNINKYLWKF